MRAHYGRVPDGARRSRHSIVAAKSAAGRADERQLDELVQFLEALAGREPRGGLIEVRYREPEGGMRQRFHRADRPELAARIILLLGQEQDVYVGCAPRRRRWGGRRAVERVWALWVDCDGREASGRLERFEPAPAIVVRSGSGDNRHAYWPLAEPLPPAEAEAANARLALALGGDPASTDAARILRPPHTCNFKHDPPAAVLLERLSDHRQMAADVVAGLPELPHTIFRSREPGPTLRRGDPLRAIEPAIYVEALTGQRVGRSRKVSCPFHDDATPSLHVYEEPEGGWFCFSCRRGTSVYDLAGPLWGLRTRGVEFLELRRRLTELLLPGVDAGRAAR